MNEILIEKLDKLFGSYKAEWLQKDIFKFFTEPYYFAELKNSNPFVLQGGRGTGKTTVLRGLSYQGQFEILNSDINKFDKNNFIGIYYRANTNHVRAFTGKGVSEDRWKTIFEHYVNLIMCWEILDFIDWHKSKKNDDEELSADTCRQIASSLHLEAGIENFKDLLIEIKNTVLRFQAEINNIADGNMPKMSMAGVPIEILTSETEKLKQFQGKIFYLLIDEYENFTDYQQECMNTFIKHVPESYTIKIGVREMGWRVKMTHNPMESLNAPADYNTMNIEELFTDPQAPTRFEQFASNVCNLRLRQLLDDNNDSYDIRKALRNMTIEEESEKLNVKKADFYKSFVKAETDGKRKIDIHPLYKYFIAYWAYNHNDSLESEIDNYLLHPASWHQRYENYKYSLLFKLNRGKYIAIPKYYAGWSTFIKLANGNIRYLMTLVHQSYRLHIENNRDIKEAVSVENQTIAAKNVGWKNLTELEGSCNIGVKLTQLVQSLGTIFKRLARDGDKNAPEVDQFDMEGEISIDVRNILNLAVMNLALVRMPSNKMSGLKSIKDFQYQLHPIFAPFFDYSFRKKRKMTLTNSDIIGCIETPNDTVAAILGRRNVSTKEDKTVPTQLSLFDFNDFIS